MSAVPFLLMLGGILWGLALWMHRETERRGALERWRALVLNAPEPSHVTVHASPPPGFAFDWQHLCPALRLPITKRGTEEAA